MVASSGQKIADGTGSTFTFTPGNAGTYTLTYTVIDPNVGWDSSDVVITSDDVPPVLTANGNSQGVYTGVSTAIDLGTLAVAGGGPFTSTVQWGDGQTSTFSPSTSGPLSLAHAYATAGTYTIDETIAEYYGGSTTAEFSVTVSNASTSTALQSSAPSAVYGQSVTFTAIVTGPGDATGPVDFYSGPVNSADLIGTGMLGVVNGQDVATFTTRSLPVSGTPYAITAVYGGDPDNVGSTSNVLSQTMGRAPLAITIADDSQTYGKAADLATDLGTTIDTGVNGQTLSIAYSSIGDTDTADAGTYAITGTLSDGTGQLSDYTVELTDGTLTVDKAAAIITVTPYSVTIDGRPHTATGTATGVESPTPANLDALLDLGGTTHIDAGSYTDTWTFSGNLDYRSATGTVNDVIDDPSPTIASIAAISPNPRNSAVSSVDVTFSEPINASNLSPGALTLTDDGGSNLINSGVSLSLVSGDTYAIGGLSTLTVAPGAYELTVNAADILPQYGPSGTGTASTTWLMDTTPPISKVNPLPSRGTSLSFPVAVTGSDPNAADGGPASGVASYTIFVSIDGGGWSKWTTVPAANPTATYTGASNTTYSFYSLATDLAGNVENKSPLIEASTYLPDLTPPVTAVNPTTGTNPSTVNSTTGAFTLDLTGSDPGGAALTYFEVFVSIDGGTYQEVGPYAIPAGFADASGHYHSTIAYQGLTDGQSHTYSFYSIGLDAAGNLQGAPKSPNVTFANQVFTPDQPSQLQVTSLTVEHGSPSRSFIQYLDLGFNESDAQSDSELKTIVNSVGTASPDIAIYKYDLNGDASSKTAVPLSSPTMLSVLDHAIEINFGSGGIGNSPTSTAADGYYEVDIKLPGGQTAVHHFDRLLGDVAGDGIVDQHDLNEIAASMNESSQLGWAPFERLGDGRRDRVVAGPAAGDTVEEPEAGNGPVAGMSRGEIGSRPVTLQSGVIV